MEYRELVKQRTRLAAELQELAEVVAKTGLLKPRDSDPIPDLVSKINKSAETELRGVETRIDELRAFLGYSSESDNSP